MISKSAIVLFPLFWPDMPPLSLAMIKEYASARGSHVDAYDYNNTFFAAASGTLKDAWRLSVNSELENNIYGIMKSEYGRVFSEMTERLLGYDYLGISVYRNNRAASFSIAQDLKRKKPGIRIAFGGPEITRQFFIHGKNFHRYMGQYGDFYVAGEGEKSFEEFITGKTKGKQSSIYDEIEKPEELPGPDYSDFDLSSYNKHRSISLMLSRGCIRKCAFCSERLLYKKYINMPVNKTLTQIAFYKKKGIDHFIFHDSLINGNLEALSALCKGIILDFGRISWEAQLAVRKDMPDELFAAMKESGARHLFVGLESGSRETLKKMNKGFTPEDALKFFGQLNAAGLSFGVSLITGFPGETDGDFNDSIKFVVENKHLIKKIEQINPYVYYDGTNLPEDADYRSNHVSVERAKKFVTAIKKNRIKHTNAFMFNLVESAWK